MNPAHADTLQIFVSPSVITLQEVTCHYYPCGILGLQALVHFPGSKKKKAMTEMKGFSFFLFVYLRFFFLLVFWLAAQ